MVDWGTIRTNKYSRERPPEWPQGIYGIAQMGLALLGINERTGTLYWDGKEIVTRGRVKLGTYERWVAGIAAFATFGMFVIQAGSAFGYWN